MDVLVKWDADDSENIVKLTDLHLVNKHDSWKRGTAVKMWWPSDAAYWYGHVMDIEATSDDTFEDSDYCPSTADDDANSDASSDDEPLIGFTKRLPAATGKPARPVDVEPVRSAPKEPVRSAITEAARSTATEPARSIPTEPDRSAPTEPARSTPTDAVCLDPIALVSSAPVEPVPTAPAVPVRSAPVKPVRSASAEPDLSEPSTCAVNTCSDDVYAACPMCLAFLCHDHFQNDSPCREHAGKYAKSAFMEQRRVEAGGPSAERLFPKTQADEASFSVDGPETDLSPPPKKKKSFDDWKQNVSKQRRNSGEAYEDRAGNSRPARRKLGERCPSSCKRKCKDVLDDQRLRILNSYWDLGDINAQWAYIVRHVDVVETKQITKKGAGTSRRSSSQFYHFTLDTTERLPVCKRFFLNTLGIADRQVRTALSKREEHGTIARDNRGGHRNQNKPQYVEGSRLAAQHIGLFPRVESHYLRRETSRQYLSSDLTVAKMYDLYKTWLPSNLTEGFTLKHLKLEYTAYWKVFRQFNLSFFKPKKDACGICEVYHATPFPNDVQKEEFEAHTRNKKMARAAKMSLKENLPADHMLACFDLQQVLYCPNSNIGDLFYKRLLCCYNLTVYDVGSKNGHCYFWSEDQGRRGASEVGTAVLSFLRMCSEEGKTTVYLFCDSTSSQNRNTAIASMLAQAVWSNQTALELVRLHFFEKYHGQNEGDSMHSVIEIAKKRAGPIVLPSQYATMIRMAKTSKPYAVTEFDFSSFMDLGQAATDFLTKSSRETYLEDGTPGPTMNWNKLRVLEVRRGDVGVFYVKMDYADSFLKMPLRKRRGRQPSLRDYQLQPLYTGKVGVDEDKKKDLLSLFNVVINKELEQKFYSELPIRTRTN